MQLDIDDGLFRGLEREQPVWDESWRLESRDCRKASSHGPDGFHAVRRARRRSDICTASSSTPRSPTHRGARTSCATSSVASPASSPRTAAPSRPPWPRSATASIGMLATRPPTGRSSCTVGRGRLGRRGGFGASVGDGRPASMSTMRAACEAVRALRQTFEQNLDVRLVMVDARERFLARLAGVEDPEEKRRIIGDEFIRVFEEEAAGSAGSTSSRRARSTPTSSRARPPRPRPPRRSRPTTTSGGCRPTCGSSSIEPLRYLFKDEVRKVGLELGLPEAMVLRQPFPGPASRSGSSVR